MHYLITGGCGFIGSHLIELLRRDGHKITVIDDLSTGKRENIPSDLALKVADITDPGVFDEFTETIDGCFHLAAIVSVQQSAEDWLRTHQVNQSGIVTLFDALARKKRKVPVVYASSAAAYGNCTNIPLKETEHTEPLSGYGVDKLACEYQARVATLIHGIPTAGLRFFNVYGPRQDPNSPYSGVISIFANRIKQHMPITIYGDGEQTRDFIYAGDVAQALALSMKKLEKDTQTHAVFNVCTGMGTSVKALAGMIASLTHTTSTITHETARVGDIRHSLGDPAAALQGLGFRAKMGLKEGVELTLKVL